MSKLSFTPEAFMSDRSGKVVRLPFKDLLWSVLNRQRGYIRTDQIRVAGFTNALISYHLRGGTLVRVARGVYRHADFEFHDGDELLISYLWAKERGVVSHDSSLFLWGLVDRLPEIVSLTMPKSMRRQAGSPPMATTITFANLSENQISQVGPISATPVARAIAECLDRDGVQSTQVDAALRGLERHLIRREELGSVVRGLVGRQLAREFERLLDQRLQEKANEQTKRAVVRFPGKRQTGALTNLTRLPTEFVGREQELQRIAQLVAQGKSLITLRGPAGVGKTRLAKRFVLTHMSAIADAFQAGAWFCDLAEVRTVSGIAQAVMDVLPLPDDIPVGEGAGGVVTETLSRLGSVLIVLDNFEQVAEYTEATVGQWLASLGNVQFIVTSRETLNLPGEQCIEVHPLPTPETNQRQAALDSDAVQMFLDRTRGTQSEYSFPDSDVEPVCEIVRQLDGNPLSIELAAARMAIMSPSQILVRLADRFTLLKTASRSSDPRQTSLIAALDWSWDLLNDWERSAFAQCAVFCQGFTLEAAEAVVDLSGLEAAPEVIDALQSLRNKSMLKVTPGAEDGRSRFGMYESLRQFAAQKLAGHTGAEAVEGRHTEYFLSAGEQWAQAVERSGQRDALESLAAEKENLISAFNRSLTKNRTHGNAALVVRCALILDPLLYLRGPTDLHDDILRTAVQFAADTGLNSVGSCRLIASRASNLRASGHVEEAVADYERALEMAREFNDSATRGLILSRLGFARSTQGDFEEAARCYEEAETLLSEQQDESELGILHGRIGAKAYLTDDLETAQARFEAALAAHRAAGNQWYEAIVLCNLGLVHDRAGRFRDALETLTAALELARSVGNPRTESVALGNVGHLYLDYGRHALAEDLLNKALDLHHALGNERFAGIITSYLGLLEADRGNLEAARRAFNQAVRTLREWGNERWIGRTVLQIAFLDVLEGSLNSAKTAANEAVELLERSEDRRYSAIAWALIGACFALGSEADAAADAFAKARDQIQQEPTSPFAATAHLLEGCLFSLRAATGDVNQAERVNEVVVASIRAGIEDESHPWGRPPLVRQAALCRLALRILENSISPNTLRRIRAIGIDRHHDALIVTGEGSAFRPPGADWVDLHKRRALPGILRSLVTQRRTQDAEPLTVYDLIEAGWPGEKTLPDAGAHRVYVAIDTMRKLGLRDCILRNDDGYFLSTEIALFVV